MALVRLCAKAGCCRTREAGSKYCSLHKEVEEAKDKKREEERAKNRFKYYKPNPDHAVYWQSTRWKQLSSRLLREHPCCSICGRDDIRLNVHHHYPKGYDYFNDVDFYDEDHLIVVCTACHEQLTHSDRLDTVVNHIFKFDFRK